MRPSSRRGSISTCQYAFPPDACESVHAGGLAGQHTSNVVVNFGISCGTSPDIGKFAAFAGGPRFELTQYGHTEAFIVPPGETWEVRYADDRRTFVVQ